MLKIVRNKLKSRRDRIVEELIVQTLAFSDGFRVFDTLYFEAARGYAIDRGAKATDATSASTRFDQAGTTYVVFFSKSAGGGTAIRVEEADIVEDRVMNPGSMLDYIDRQMADVMRDLRYQQAERLIAQDIKNEVKRAPSWTNDTSAFSQLFDAVYAAAQDAGMDEGLAEYWLTQPDVMELIITSLAHFEDAEFEQSEQIECTARLLGKTAKALLQAQRKRA